MDETTLNALLVTTELKRVFYHLKSVDCERSDLWKVLVWLPMKWSAWSYCLSDVISRASFSTFFTASEILTIYVVYDGLIAGILYCNFFLFHMQLLSSRPIA